MSTDALLTKQQDYYRNRARDWDQWIRHYMREVEGDFDELLAAGPLEGDVLELACGTGYWTARLSEIASYVTALDGSDEMLEVLRRRELPNVTTLRADLFTWNPPTQWDGVFFAHWLAHVPDDHFDDFWRVVDAALLPGGHVVFVDVTPAERRIEEEIVDDEAVPITRRRLKDGRRFDVVKRFWEPDELMARLAHLGWTGEFRLVGSDRARGFAYYDLERR
jgi:SAM-dependent methyltransferase